MSNLSVLAFDEAPRGNGGRGATEEIAQLLDSSEIDAPSSLYDEALALAKEGRFAPATDRLRMLLTLDPIDADASLLLGKVLAARGQWQEALQRLDAAQANGLNVPTALRDKIELSLRNQVQTSEEQRLRVAARERGEIRNLRAEAKRLRSDNAILDQQIQSLYRRVRLWSSATALVSGCAAALLMVALVSGGTESAPENIAAADSPITNEALPINEVLPSNEALVPAEMLTPAPVLEANTMPNLLPPAEAIAPTSMPTPTPNGAIMTVHTVVKGDTLGSLATQYYGKFTGWKTIKKANKDVLNGKDNLSLGQQIKIPAL
jgi:tetratricopeptide (TPR) repeat protein